MMRASEGAYAQWRRLEELRLKTYRCSAGRNTIGYGHTKTARSGQVIDLEQAEALLRADIGDAEEAVNRLVTVPLEPSQFDALIIFVGNLGSSALATSQLLRAINGRRDADVHTQWMRFVHERDPDTGKPRVVKGLRNRRRIELEMWDRDAPADDRLLSDMVAVPPPAGLPLADIPGLFVRSRTLWGALAVAFGWLTSGLEVATGWLTGLSAWASQTNAAIGPIQTLATTASGILPGLGGALTAAGLVLVVSARLNASAKGKTG